MNIRSKYSPIFIYSLRALRFSLSFGALRELFTPAPGQRESQRDLKIRGWKNILYYPGVETLRYIGKMDTKQFNNTAFINSSFTITSFKKPAVKKPTV